MTLDRRLPRGSRCRRTAGADLRQDACGSEPRVRPRRRRRDECAEVREGPATLPHVTLYTPLEVRLAAGTVCFDVDGVSAEPVVRRLEEHRIIASATPCTPSHARLEPTGFNTPEQLDFTLVVIGEPA